MSIDTPGPFSVRLAPDGVSIPETPGGPILSSQQRALYYSLSVLDRGLGSMYLGAIMVLSYGANPDCLPLAAHGIRELMEKLPRRFNVPMIAQAEKLMDKVRELERSWNDALGKTKSHCGQSWAGAVDPPLAKFLDALGFFSSQSLFPKIVSQ